MTEHKHLIDRVVNAISEADGNTASRNEAKWAVLEVLRWMRDTYHESNYYDGRKWHKLYGDFDTFSDVMSVMLNEVEKENNKDT